MSTSDLEHDELANFRSNLLLLTDSHGAVTKLAEVLGVHRVTASRLVNGHSPPDLETAVRIAKCFDRTLAEMLSESESIRSSI